MGSAWPRTAAEIGLAAEAAALVPLAAIAARALHLASAVDLVSRAARWLPGAAAEDPGRAARLVNGVAGRLGARCLTRALVVHALLARAGAASRVVVGAARRDGRLLSHAWVERDGETLGGSDAGWTAVWRSAP